MNIDNSQAGPLVLDLIAQIQTTKIILVKLTGRLGHGINMNKGFTLCQSKLAGKHYSQSEGLTILSNTLMEDIGGSMGPLYGVLFEEMAALAHPNQKLTPLFLKR